MRGRDTTKRVLACLAGVALFAAAAYGTLLVVLIGGISAQPPDPEVPSGDPCCGHPDTWGEVAQGFVEGAVGAVIVGAVVAMGSTLLVWGVRGRAPGRRVFAIAPAAGVVLLGVGMAIALAVPP